MRARGTIFRLDLDPLWLIAPVALVSCCAAFSSAEVPPEQRSEVDHLLRFVLESGCTLERNGTEHTSREAYEHMQQKYSYFRDKIRSAEDFIDRAATKSELTGRPYRVNCGEKQARTAKDWLLEELERYRRGRRGAGGRPSGSGTK